MKKAKCHCLTTDSLKNDEEGIAMSRKLEGLEDDRRDIKEGLDEATDTGREIADTKKRQAALMEGLTPPEDIDREAIRAAMDAVREDAREDYKHRSMDAVDDLSQQSEGLQRESSESEDETRSSSQRMDQAGGVSEYGKDAISRASERLNATGDEFRALTERLRTEIEEAKRKAREVEDEI